MTTGKLEEVRHCPLQEVSLQLVPRVVYDHDGGVRGERGHARVIDGENRGVPGNGPFFGRQQQSQGLPRESNKWGQAGGGVE